MRRTTTIAATFILVLAGCRDSTGAARDPVQGMYHLRSIDGRMPFQLIGDQANGEQIVAGTLDLRPRGEHVQTFTLRKMSAGAIIYDVTHRLRGYYGVVGDSIEVRSGNWYTGRVAPGRLTLTAQDSTVLIFEK